MSFIESLEKIPVPSGEVHHTVMKEIGQEKGSTAIFQAFAAFIEKHPTIDPDEDRKVLVQLLGDDALKRPVFSKLIENAANADEGASQALVEAIRAPDNLMSRLRDTLASIAHDNDIQFSAFLGRDNSPYEAKPHWRDSLSEENTQTHDPRNAKDVRPTTSKDDIRDSAQNNTERTSKFHGENDNLEQDYDDNAEHYEQSQRAEIEAYMRLYAKVEAAYNKTLMRALQPRTTHGPASPSP